MNYYSFRCPNCNNDTFRMLGKGQYDSNELELCDEYVVCSKCGTDCSYPQDLSTVELTYPQFMKTLDGEE